MNPQKLLLKLNKEETWRKLGESMDLPASYLHDVAHGKRPASDKLLEALGLERVVTYRTKR
jgi:hypothetical protein